MATLYARSDLVHIMIPAETGGCGSGHSRPVIGGAPARMWQLDCPRCTVFLKGDALWSSNPAKIPLTPDEENAAEVLREENARMRAEEDALNRQLSTESVKSQLEKQRIAEQYETERTILEMRLAQMSA